MRLARAPGALYTWGKHEVQGQSSPSISMGAKRAKIGGEYNTGQLATGKAARVHRGTRGRKRMSNLR